MNAFTARTLRVVLTSCLCAAAACSSPSAPPPLVALTAGTIPVAGLSAPVRIVRDTWGVPHLYAETENDLFVAQGFVQAEDRLFQMDLWKRSSQGRLSQVLGPNFIERDAMTRRFQYRGDLRIEWNSYGADAERIAQAFVSGINAWVELARSRPPEEFVAAGWKPEYWMATDLLSRTDAFLASGDAVAEVQRKNMNDVVAEAIRRVGTAPFFAALGGPVAAGTLADAQPEEKGLRGQRPVAGCAGTAGSGRLVFDDLADGFEEPSRRYLVHLHAPGWNVIGVTRPWLPGVAAGHNERMAWAPVPVAADTEDVYEDLASSSRTIGREPIVVKGRRTPFVFDVDRTAHGLVVASDRARGASFTVRWSGTEAGAAAELASLAVDRAASWTEFRAAAARWKMPVARLLYADVAGTTGFQDAGLVPLRTAGEWMGWQSLDALPHGTSDGGRWTAGAEGRGPSGAPDSRRRVIFASVLGVTGTARRRFDAGPFPAPPGDDNPMRLELVLGNWDDSRAMNAPGQSEAPASRHRTDGAQAWSAGTWMPLPFTDEAVRTSARETLTLVPKRPAT